MISQYAFGLEIDQSCYAFVGMWSVTHEVPRNKQSVYAAVPQSGNGRLKRRIVGVDVGKQADTHQPAAVVVVAPRRRRYKGLSALPIKHGKVSAGSTVDLVSLLMAHRDHLAIFIPC